MNVGDRVVTYSNTQVNRRDQNDSPRDLVKIDVPKGTMGEIIGMGPVPKRGLTRMYKIQVTGGLLNAKIFWLPGKILRPAY